MNFVSCNFGLKSYLRLQIKFGMRIRFEIARVISDQIADYIINYVGILFLFFSNHIECKLEKRVLVVFIPEFCTTAWARGLLDWGRIQLKVGEGEVNTYVLHESVKYHKTSCIIFFSCNFCVIKVAMSSQSWLDYLTLI